MLARRLQQGEEELTGCLSPTRMGYVFDNLTACAASIVGRLLPDVKACLALGPA